MLSLRAVLLVTTLLLAVVNCKILYRGKEAAPISVQPSMLPSVACNATPGPLFQGKSPPYPTDTWWVGAGVLPQTSQLAGPFPYTTSTANLGLIFGLPRGRSFDGTSIHSPFEKNFQVGASELVDNINNRKALAWDEFGVTIQWFNGASTMTAYLVQGAGYLTFAYNAATVKVAISTSTLSSVNGQTVPSSGAIAVAGTKFKLVLANGNIWLIYTLSSASLSFTQSSFYTTAQWTGVVRFAALNDTAAESAFDASASTYATGGDIAYNVTGNTALVTFAWKTVGDASKLLHLAWIHHRNAFVGATYASTVQFLTVKGWQKGVLGGSWTLKYALPSISWYAPRQPDSSCIQVLNLALNDEIASINPPVPGDFYFWGGSVARLARLAVIAEELGRYEVISNIVSALKTSFQPWLDGTLKDPAAYETGWGGVVSKPGAADANYDYGNGFYNDHHFHYGYHLYAASVIAKYDSSWFNTNQRYVTELARDIGNPSTQDTFSTVARHRDWFAGHSWASGIANGAGGRDEESTTEAINGYYGLYMYALVTKNCDLQNWARLLLATEISGVQTYWHMSPTTTAETAYPEQAIRNYVTIGNVQDQQAGPWLFWGSQKSEIAAIQILPLTPITEYVVDTDWGKNMYQYTSVEFGDSSVADSWKSVIYAAHSQWDPVTAFGESQKLTDWGSGNSNLNTIWFISTRALSNTGNVCAGALVKGVTIYTGALFSKSANKYITLDSGSNAVATAASVAGATIFNFGAISGGTTIQNNATKSYASSDAGSAPMIVNRASPSGWETYVFYQLPSNTYAIRASSNGQYLGVNSNGQLVNNIVASTPSAVPSTGIFQAVCPNGASSCPGPVIQQYTYKGNTTNTPPITSNCGSSKRSLFEEKSGYVRIN